MESTGRQLLENVTITEDENGSQFMIQRMSVDNAQLLSSELLQHHNGLVVDLGGDFIPVNYTSEDLLSQDLTEEDRNLAAALVAVQFSQQQKQQQTQQDSGGVIINTSLPSLVAAGSLDENKVTLNDQQVILQDNKTGYLQIVDAENLYKHPEFAQYDESDSSIQLIKTEDEHDGEQRTSKKSLPHKKRISRKLKKVTVAKKAHKCNLCEQVFTSEEYAEHQQLCQTTITPIPNAFLCQLCNSAFADQLQFFEHLKIHYEPIGQHQGDEDEEEQHVQDEEEEEEEVEQVIAEPVLKEASAKRLKVDPETQKESLLTSILQLTCMECNKTFRRQKSFDLHVREYHSKDEMNEFSEPEDLMAGIDVNAASEMDEDNKAWYRDDELHATEEDLKEMEAKEHVCHNCQQPFPIRAILLQHLLTCRSSGDGTKINITEIKEEYKKKKTKKADMECTICDRKFTHRNSLVYHMRGHTGDRPHQCDQCGKSFFGASALKVHLRLHSGEKPYRCEFCGRNFRQWGDLKYHCISIHSDQKQYQCEYCGKDFARKYSLIVHRRIHTGEKNYRCEFCGKTFRASSYLQNHRRIHTGEKPHPCEICGKRFRVRSDMKRHLRTHTRRRIGRTITMPMNGELKMEDADGEMHEMQSEDTNESILKETENDAAVQSLQYEQETLEAVRDGNTLYVMPILIT